MASSFKPRNVSDAAAGLTLFIVWYISAAATVTVMQERFVVAMMQSLAVLLLVVVFMTGMFAVSRILKRTDVVDVAWGLAFFVAAVSSYIMNPYGITIGLNVQTLVTALVAIWAARLSYTIGRRLLIKPEDHRYVTLRKQWKGNAGVNTYVRIFLVQALLATVISSAVIHTNLSLEAGIGIVAIIGAAVWLLGFVFESVGDWQLKRHLADSANRGKLMTRGLWKYTRHPNYFGEATMWWGIFIIGLSTPYGWLGIVTPVIITYLLLFVSGVPMTEKSFKGKLGWNEYKRRTSMFVPLPPREP